MKKILTFLFLLFINNTILTSELNFRINIVITNQKHQQEPTGRFDKLVFGLDEKATDYLDTALGESELFPSHPPSGVHAVFEIPEKDKPGKIWSYKDIRPIDEKDQFEVTYTINMQKDIFDTITFNWQPLPKEYLDSAILCDNILGTLFRVSMLDKNQAVNTNIGLSKFEIKLWVNRNKTSVINELHSRNNNFDISPNPATDFINIITDESLNNKITIYNLLGFELWKGRIEDSRQRIDISFLPAGIYFVNYGENNRLLIKY